MGSVYMKSSMENRQKKFYFVYFNSVQLVLGFFYKIVRWVQVAVQLDPQDPPHPIVF